MSERPVGIFDSGVGGLSVWRHIRRVIPDESLYFVADSAYAPYGEKSVDAIIERSLSVAAFLMQQKVKAIVIACNTATAAAASAVRQAVDIPVVAMEPALKPASESTHTGTIGVLATTSTIQSERYQHLVNRFGAEVEIINQPAPGLVECIERGELDSTHIEQLLQQYVSPMIAAGIDKLVLGCTHYPFVIPALQAILGDGVEIIDTGAPVACQLRKQLMENQLLNKKSDHMGDRFFSSSDPAHLQQMLALLLGINASVASLA